MVFLWKIRTKKGIFVPDRHKMVYYYDLDDYRGDSCRFHCQPAFQAQRVGVRCRLVARPRRRLAWRPCPGLAWDYMGWNSRRDRNRCRGGRASAVDCLAVRQEVGGPSLPCWRGGAVCRQGDFCHGEHPERVSPGFVWFCMKHSYGMPDGLAFRGMVFVGSYMQLNSYLF